jgi:ribosomal protein L11 methyltransferase
LDFVELKVTVAPDFSDILVAELAEIGFESFVDTEQGLDAYIPSDLFEEQRVEEIRQKYSGLTKIAYSFSTIERKNWNEEWEKNYQPIMIGQQCLVRASFHKSSGEYPYEIVVNPKMSFGTGHHETTALMLENQLYVSHEHKSVLDVGCGTGILAIMACKLKASKIDAFDTDEWAVENSRENFVLNHCTIATVQRGTITEVKLAPAYDIILANINRNVLLQEIPAYAALLPEGGFLLLSGFYEKDITDIEKLALAQGLSKSGQRLKQSWASLVLKK